MAEGFYGYMKGFLKEKKAKDVVEVGSDIQLKLALNLAPYCQNFYSVNFPEDHEMMNGWYSMHKKMGAKNIELLSGNAMELSSLIPHADIILLQNVLLDLTGKDTELMLRYRRKETECSEEQWNELVSRFRQAEEKGFREFLKVASPGYIVKFDRPESDGSFEKIAVGKLGVKPARIERKELLYDDTGDLWEAYIIDNS